MACCGRNKNDVVIIYEIMMAMCVSCCTRENVTFRSFHSRAVDFHRAFRC